MNEAFFPYINAKMATIAANTRLNAAAVLKLLYCLLCNTFVFQLQIYKGNEALCNYRRSRVYRK